MSECCVVYAVHNNVPRLRHSAQTGRPKDPIGQVARTDLNLDSSLMSRAGFRGTHQCSRDWGSSVQSVGEHCIHPVCQHHRIEGAHSRPGIAGMRLCSHSSLTADRICIQALRTLHRVSQMQPPRAPPSKIGNCEPGPEPGAEHLSPRLPRPSADPHGLLWVFWMNFAGWTSVRTTHLACPAGMASHLGTSGACVKAPFLVDSRHAEAGGWTSGALQR